MKFHKTAVIVGVVFCGLLGVALLYAIRNRSIDPEFSLSSCRKLAFVTGEEFVYAGAMDKILVDLPKSKRFVWNQPDRVLLLYSNSLSEPRFLSIFLKEGFVYEGNYLDAWTERMEEKKSPVYLLNANKCAQIEALLQ